MASAQVVQEEKTKAGSLSRNNFFIPKLGLRARQVALLTLVVATIVAVINLAYIAYLTNSIISRTRDQASQLLSQIRYEIQQDLVRTDVVALQGKNAFVALASDKYSGTRKLMESQITIQGAISYLYITNEDDQIVTDEKGQNPLAANSHRIGDLSTPRPDLDALARENGYLQIIRVLSGGPIYEYRNKLSNDPKLIGQLHIGFSTSLIRGELVRPIVTNVLIGLIAVLGAAIVAGISANVLLRPLEVISSRIEKLEKEPESVDEENLPRDEMVTGVTARLKQLGARLADERSELEIMRGRLRQVIGHLEDRLLLINREGRVILASPDAEQILGLESTELTGLPIDESLGINHPLLNLVEQAFNERRTIQRTVLHVPDGRKGRQILASVQYIEDAGETIGALVSLRDYESFKKFESQWDVSKKLADLGRITSGIAHEVKNPLNAMVIHLEILRSKMETGAADPTPQIEILDSEIRRLDRVVQTFLNFTRPVEVRLEPLDLNTVVNQVVALAAMEAAERGVTINKELSPGQLMVKGDADLLKQTLLNIILNGCQAMPEGGPLKIVTLRDENEAAKILVSDRGIGIPIDARDRIFNLYYTTKQGGSGIGLAQAFRAMQLHNGSIRLDSEVGVGTTFEISLPAMA